MAHLVVIHALLDNHYRPNIHRPHNIANLGTPNGLPFLTQRGELRDLPVFLPLGISIPNISLVIVFVNV